MDRSSTVEAAPAASGKVGSCLWTSVGAESPGAHQAAAASQGGPGGPALGGARIHSVAASGGFAEANASAQCLTVLAADEPGPSQSGGRRYPDHHAVLRLAAEASVRPILWDTRVMNLRVARLASASPDEPEGVERVPMGVRIADGRTRTPGAPSRWKMGARTSSKGQRHSSGLGSQAL